MTMTTEEMQKAWEEMSRRLERLENHMEINNEAIEEKRATVLDSLAKRYKRFSRLGLCMAFISPLYFATHVFVTPLNLWGPIAMILYFGLCSIMDWELYKKVKGIDVFTMTAQEVAENAAKCRRLHFQCMAILIPFMLVIIGMFIYGHLSDTYLLCALICGFVLGAVIGAIQLMNFLSDYRVLKIG